MNHWYLIITLIGHVGAQPSALPQTTVIEFDSREACDRVWNNYSLDTVQNLTVISACVAKGEWK